MTSPTHSVYALVAKAQEPRAGDYVRHLPSGETWLVAYARNGYVACCGWPLTEAPLSDCQIVERCTDEVHRKRLEELAAMSEPDPRRAYASEALRLLPSPSASTEEGDA